MKIEVALTHTYSTHILFMPPSNPYRQLPTNVYSEQLPLTSAMYYTDTSRTKNTRDLTSGPGPTSTSCLTKTTTILSSGYSTRTSTVRRLNFCSTYQRCVES